MFVCFFSDLQISSLNMVFALMCLDWLKGMVGKTCILPSACISNTNLLHSVIFCLSQHQFFSYYYFIWCFCIFLNQIIQIPTFIFLYFISPPQTLTWALYYIPHSNSALSLLCIETSLCFLDSADDGGHKYNFSFSCFWCLRAMCLE